MIPIAEYDGSDVDVIFYLTWTVNNHSSCDTGRVLSAVVGVIPRCAVDIGKERIGHACSRGNRALIDSRNTIVPRSSLLQKSMPMYRSTFFGACDFVTYVHGDRVAPVGFNHWTREFAVDKNDASVYSIGGYEATSDVEVVRGALAACRDCQHTRNWTRDFMLLTTVEVCGVGIVVTDCIGSPGDDIINSGD